MKKKIVSLFVCGLIIFSSKAQGGMFENWAVGVNAGLYGVGIQGATSLTPNLKLRAGFDYLHFNYNEAIDFDAEVANAPEGSQIEELYGDLNDLKLRFPNAKALVDFYPMKNGVFCLTAGFYLGSNTIKANGLVTNYDRVKQQMGGVDPQFEFEGTVIDPKDGKFDATLKLGNVIKPYFGIGLGRTIANSRVGFKFELGMVYQGKLKVESSNIVKTDYNLDDVTSNFDMPVPKNLLNWWPMLNFALSYRIR